MTEDHTSPPLIKGMLAFVGFIGAVTLHNVNIVISTISAVISVLIGLCTLYLLWDKIVAKVKGRKRK